MRILILFIVCFICFTGCKDTSDDHILKVHVEKDSSFCPETTENALIRFINKVIVGKNRIYLLDQLSNSVMIFDTAGIVCYKLDFGDLNLKKEQVKRMTGGNFIPETSDYIYKLTNIKEMGNYMFYGTDIIYSAGVIDKQNFQSNLYSKVFDNRLNLPFPKIIPCEDSSHSMLGCSLSVPVLKREIEKRKNSDNPVPAWLVSKVGSMEEDSNPLLFFYKLRK